MPSRWSLPGSLQNRTNQGQAEDNPDKNKRGFRTEANVVSRRPSLVSVLGGKSSWANTPRRKLKINEGDGIKDYRLFPRWSFLTQPFLRPDERDSVSIGTLYVHVMQARGLMSSDLNGSSDPYVKLCLTGRYLSHGQEWSEKLRLENRTRTVKRSLDPVWDEEFSLPIRRAGAILTVEVWDWDLSSTDDPLGHFEVKIGEELLSQKPMDMWYVLEPPRGMTMSRAAAKAKKRGSSTEDEDHQDQEEQQDQQDQDMIGEHLSRGQRSLADDSGVEPEDGGEKVERTAKVSAGRLKMRAVSELEPHEEPPRVLIPPEEGVGGADEDGEGSVGAGGKRFSAANKRGHKSELGRRNKTLRVDHDHDRETDPDLCEECIELRRKTFGEVRLKLWYQFDEFAETCSHVWPEEPLNPESTYFSPNQLYRKGMVLYEMARPYLNFIMEADKIMSWAKPLISLVWLVVLLLMLLVPYVLIVVVNGALIRIVVRAYLKHRPGGHEAHDQQAGDTPLDSSSQTPYSPTSTTVDASSGASRRPSLNSVLGLFVPPQSHEGGMLEGSLSGERPVTDVESADQRSAPGTPLNSPTPGPETWTGFSGGGISCSSRSAPPNSPNLTARAKSKKLSSGAAASAIYRGKRVKGIKKLLPTHVTMDPEMEELNRRLGSTKKLPRLLNEVGKWLLGRNGPLFQDRVEKLGMMLIKVRKRFHPLDVKHLVLMITALTAHMLLQLWLYHTGRFNLYFVLACAAQFSNRLYRRWGKAFVLGLKEAARTRRLRLDLAQLPDLSSPNAHTPPSPTPSTPPSSPQPRPRPCPQSIPSLGLPRAMRRRSTSKQKHPAFAPPGSTPAHGPLAPTPGAASFYDRLSPTRRQLRHRSALSTSAPGIGDKNGQGLGRPALYRERRASSPTPVGNADSNLRRWSYSWGNNKRGSLAGKVDHWNEPSVGRERRGVVESSPGLGGAGSAGDAAATLLPHERQTAENSALVIRTSAEVLGGSAAPPPGRPRPRQPRQSVRARRRVRWGRVLVALTAVGCVLLGVAAAFRVFRGGGVSSCSSGTFGYARLGDGVGSDGPL